MDYEKIHELLPDYARGRLSPAEADQVRLAVEGSESLRREKESLQAYYKALSTQAPVRAPGDFLVKVNAKIDARQGLLARVLLPVWPKVPLELAGLAVTVVLVIVLFNPFTLRNVPPEVLEQPAPAAERKAPAEKPPQPSVAASDLAKPETPARSSDKKGTATSPAEKRAPAQPPRSDPAAAPAAGAGLASGDARAHAVGEVKKESGFAEAMPYASEPTARDEDLAELATAPAPAAAPSAAGGSLAEAENSKAKDAEGLALERRRLKQETEAVSVMTVVIDDRSLDRSDVDDSRRSRGKTRAAAEVASEAKAQDAAPAPVVYRSLEEKAFGLVEDIVRRHGGTLTLRSVMNAPKPQRTYVVSLPREEFEAAREELRALGTVSDIDLNLDASDAARLYFRLGVTVE